MCHETAHFLSGCPILAEYTRLGKVSRNAQNLLVLGNGDPIPNDPMNHSWAAWVNDFYLRNPHLLKDPPPHTQENFAANLLEVHKKSPLREEKYSLFTHLDSINKEDEELSSLGGEIKDDKLQLNRYIEVLQIKRKEMDSAKKSPDLPTLTPVWPMDAPLTEKTYYLVPKLQAPSAKPLPSTPMLVDPTPQFRYMAPIKSKVNTSDVNGLLGKLPTFPILSLGLHCHTKLLLHSCHGHGNGVLDIDVHWDIIGDGHYCRVQSLLDVSGIKWHCW